MVLGLLLVACAGGESGSNDDTGSNGETDGPSATNAPAGGGNVVNRQPPGQGYASVDGLEYTFDTTGGLDCETSAEEFSFSYVIGDNEVIMGGGASISGGQWFGNLTLQIFGDNEVTEYVALVVDHPEAIAVDGDSVSYSGPMQLSVPPEDGNLMDPIDVGNGTFSSTCG
jgi:hypothetical protein